jgi:hypothetical protein
VIEHPFGARDREAVRGIAAGLIDRLVAAAVTASATPDEAVVAASVPAPVLELPADLAEFHLACAARGLSDGLPVIPPTADRVARMVAASGLDPSERIALLAPAFGEATVERIAVNAVMAGCVPAHLPLLVAAVEAAADPAFNLQAVQSTTNPVTTWLIVNGPIAQAIGMNSGINCLGQGNLANATLGRALRLVMQNIGGAIPGDMDRATHGQPGKFLFCCAENEASSPWPALHVDRGWAVQDSVVTVVGASGTHNLNTHSKDAEELLACLARSMAFPASNDYHYGGQPWLILSPEHANVLAAAGYDKPSVQARLWAQSKICAGDFAVRDYERTGNARKGEFRDYSLQTMVPLSRTSADIGIIVSGGPGTHSVYVPTFGETRAVTRKIRS